MHLEIRLLSPVHIGNGERYRGLSFIDEDTKIYVIDFDKVKRVLSNHELERLAGWLITEDMPTWKSFGEYMGKRDLLVRLKDAALYSIKKDTDQRPREIECFIKQGSHVYIPGSEIKGAIRTAIMHHFLVNYPKYHKFLDESLLRLRDGFRRTFDFLSSCGKRAGEYCTRSDISRIGREELVTLLGRAGQIVWDKVLNGQNPNLTIRQIKSRLAEKVKKISDELEKKVFRPPGKSDAKYDLLKFLRISDTEGRPARDNLFLGLIEPVNVSRKFSIFQEMCETGTIFHCELVLNYNRTQLTSLGFSKEQIEIISDKRYVFQCIYDFSKRLIGEEQSYSSYSPSIKNGLGNLLKNNELESPVARIGKNEGFLSLTVGLAIKDRNWELYDRVLSHCTKNTSYTGNFPKTRKILVRTGNRHELCGWIKLIPF